MRIFCFLASLQAWPLVLILTPRSHADLLKSQHDCSSLSLFFLFFPFCSSVKTPFCPPHSWVMTFPWNCHMCPKPSFHNSPTFMLFMWSGMEEKLFMFVVIDSPWREYRSRKSPAGVVVEVLGIRILHLANLQCGRRQMTLMLGSGRKRNYALCEEKGNPTGLYFCVIME